MEAVEYQSYFRPSPLISPLRQSRQSSLTPSRSPVQTTTSPTDQQNDSSTSSEGHQTRHALEVPKIADRTLSSLLAASVSSSQGGPDKQGSPSGSVASPRRSSGYNLFSRLREASRGRLMGAEVHHWAMESPRTPRSPGSRRTADLQQSPAVLSQQRETRRFSLDMMHEHAWPDKDEDGDGETSVYTDMPSREVSFAATAPAGNETETQKKKKKGWGIKKLFGKSSHKHAKDKAETAAPTQTLPRPTSHTPPTTQTPARPQATDTDSSARGSQHSHRSLRSILRSRSSSFHSRDKDGDSEGHSHRLHRPHLNLHKDKKESDSMYVLPQQHVTASSPRTVSSQSLSYDGGLASQVSLMPAGASETSHKKRAWYKKVFGGKKKKSDSSPTERAVSFVSQPVTFEAPASSPVVTNAELAAAGDETPTDKKSTATTKSKGWKIFGGASSSSKKKKGDETSPKNKETETPRDETLRGETNGTVQISVETIDAEEKARLARLKVQTRDEFLDALRDLQKRFLMRQGQHCLWKHQRLRLLLERDETDHVRQTREDIVLEDALAVADQARRQEWSKLSDTLLKTAETYTKIAETGQPVDLRRIDWRVIDVNEQLEAMRVAFAMSQVAKVVRQMFEEEGESRALAQLVKDSEDQIELWVSQRFVQTPHSTDLHAADDFKKFGQLRQGKLLLEHLDAIMSTMSHAVHESYYQDMSALSRDVENLREHIYTLIDEAFEYFKPRLLPQQLPVFQMGQSPPYQTPQCISDEFVIPVFLMDKLNIYTPSVPPQIATQPNENKSLRPANLRDQKEATLRRLGMSQKGQVGEGFALSSTRADLDKAELALGGKWGSYRLFEKWLHDATKWQWKDLALNKSMVDDRSRLEQMIEEKKKFMRSVVDKKLTQLWMGRATEANAEAVQLLSSYLTEAVNQRPALFIQATAHEMEQQAMAAEDERAHLLRQLEGPIGRELVRGGSNYVKRKNGLVIDKVESIDGMIDLLQEIRQVLDKDGNLLKDLEAQTILEDIKEEADRTMKAAAALSKERSNKESSLGRKREANEKRLEEARALLETEKQRLKGLEDGADELEGRGGELLSLQTQLEETRHRTLMLTEQLKQAKMRSKSVEKETKLTKKKLDEEQKRVKALEKEHLKIAVQSCIDPSEESPTQQQQQQLLRMPSNQSEMPRKKKTWLNKILGGGTGSMKHSKSQASLASPLPHDDDEDQLPQVVGSPQSAEATFETLPSAPVSAAMVPAPVFSRPPVAPSPTPPTAHEQTAMNTSETAHEMSRVPFMVPSVSSPLPVSSPVLTAAKSAPPVGESLAVTGAGSPRGGEIAALSSGEGVPFVPGGAAVPPFRRTASWSETDLTQQRPSVGTSNDLASEGGAHRKKARPLWKKMIGSKGHKNADPLAAKLAEPYVPLSAEGLDSGYQVSEGGKRKKKGWGWLVGKGKNSRSSKHRDKTAQDKDDEQPSLRRVGSVASAAGSRENSWRRRVSQKVHRRRSVDANSCSLSTSNVPRSTPSQMTSEPYQLNPTNTSSSFDSAHKVTPRQQHAPFITHNSPDRHPTDRHQCSYAKPDFPSQVQQQLQLQKNLTQLPTLTQQPQALTQQPQALTQQTTALTQQLDQPKVSVIHSFGEIDPEPVTLSPAQQSADEEISSPQFHGGGLDSPESQDSDVYLDLNKPDILRPQQSMSDEHRRLKTSSSSNDDIDRRTRRLEPRIDTQPRTSPRFGQSSHLGSTQQSDLRTKSEELSPHDISSGERSPQSLEISNEGKPVQSSSNEIVLSLIAPSEASPSSPKVLARTQTPPKLAPDIRRDLDKRVGVASDSPSDPSESRVQDGWSSMAALSHPNAAETSSQDVLSYTHDDPTALASETALSLVHSTTTNAPSQPRLPSPERQSPHSPSPERHSPHPPSPERHLPHSPSPERHSPHSPSPERHSPHSPSPERHSPRPARTRAQSEVDSPTNRQLKERPNLERAVSQAITTRLSVTIDETSRLNEPSRLHEASGVHETSGTEETSQVDTSLSPVSVPLRRETSLSDGDGKSFRLDDCPSRVVSSDVSGLQLGVKEKEEQGRRLECPSGTSSGQTKMTTKSNKSWAAFKWFGGSANKSRRGSMPETAEMRVRRKEEERREKELKRQEKEKAKKGVPIVAGMKELRSGDSSRQLSFSPRRQVFAAPRTIESRRVSNLYRQSFDQLKLPVFPELLIRLESACLLNDEERRAIERASKVVTFEKGDFVWSKGSEMDRVFFIRTGHLQVQDTAEGDIQLGPADVLFEVHVDPYIRNGGALIRAPTNAVATTQLTAWSVPIQILRDAVAVASKKVRAELAKIIKGADQLRNLTWVEVTNLANHLEPQLLTEAQVIDSTNAGKTFWIVWHGCVISIDQTNERMEQYHQGDMFGLDEFGVDRRGQTTNTIEISSQAGAVTTLFAVSLSQVEMVAGETLAQLDNRYPSKKTDLPLMLASMDSVSVIGDMKKKKRKKGLSGVISTSAKFLGMKKSGHHAHTETGARGNSFDEPERSPAISSLAGIDEAHSE